MSYYMEVSSCPTLPLSWVPNCPVPNCPVSKCPVPSCPVSSCPGFLNGMLHEVSVFLPALPLWPIARTLFPRMA